MSLRSRLSPNRSFHCTLKTRVSLPSPPPLECSLHILYALPPIAFIDPYELAHHSQHYAFHYEAGTKNLELPLVAVDQSVDGALMLDVAIPMQEDDGDGELEFDVKVPVHFRYGQPKHNTDDDEEEATVSGKIPPPTGFIACPRTPSSSSPQPSVPFPHALPPTWTFFQSKDITHVLPSFSEQVSDFVDWDPLSFEIPVGRMADVAQVEIGTALVILLCFFYLVRVALRSRRRLNERAAAAARMKEE